MGKIYEKLNWFIIRFNALNFNQMRKRNIRKKKGKFTIKKINLGKSDDKTLSPKEWKITKWTKSL